MEWVRLRTVDAFTNRPFTGNPAAVVVLDSAPPDQRMADVARETNLSDTGSYFASDFRLRWFTRGAVEVDLCGHATLATARTRDRLLRARAALERPQLARVGDGPRAPRVAGAVAGRGPRW